MRAGAHWVPRCLWGRVEPWRGESAASVGVGGSWCRTGGSRDGAVAGGLIPCRSVAERYVRLVLAVGQHDGDYVDAYYGPPEWRTEAERVKVPLATLDEQAAALEADLARRRRRLAGRMRPCGRCAGST